ncbi:hypothetical protein WDJ51_08160 [Rathayibacter sp. YIM 133350]|uniref:hypothetical protein n=1 Tax=Rathayibacter sp. YIM 133350 TaxID=3131992 RepID=UPI00307CDA23
MNAPRERTHARRPHRPIAIALAAVVSLTPALAGCSVQDIVNKVSGGQVAVGSGKLPSDWPKEVPVVEGEVLFGARGSGDGQKGWIVTISAKGADPLADARAKLEVAGFTPDEGADMQGADGGVVAMTNEDYGVVVAGSKDGLIYTVTPVEASTG